MKRITSAVYLGTMIGVIAVLLQSPLCAQETTANTSTVETSTPLGNVLGILEAHAAKLRTLSIEYDVHWEYSESVRALNRAQTGREKNYYGRGFKGTVSWITDGWMIAVQESGTVNDHDDGLAREIRRGVWYDGECTLNLEENSKWATRSLGRSIGSTSPFDMAGLRLGTDVLTLLKDAKFTARAIDEDRFAVTGITGKLTATLVLRRSLDYTPVLLEVRDGKGLLLRRTTTKWDMSEEGPQLKGANLRFYVKPGDEESWYEEVIVVNKSTDTQTPAMKTLSDLPKGTSFKDDLTDSSGTIK